MDATTEGGSGAHEPHDGMHDKVAVTRGRHHAAARMPTGATVADMLALDTGRR